MNSNLLSSIEKLSVVEIQALSALLDVIKGISNEAYTTANAAMDIAVQTISGEPVNGKTYQVINFKTLFGQDAALRPRSTSFIVGSKGYLGYANDANGSYYQDPDFSDIVQNLSEIEVVNRRTLLNALQGITQNVGGGFLNKLEDDEVSEGVTTRFSKVVFKGNGYKAYYRTTNDYEEVPLHEIINYATLVPLLNKTWKSKKIAIGADLTQLSGKSVYVTSQVNIANQTNGGYLAKILKLNAHAAIDNSDSTFLTYYSNNEILGISGATLPLVQLPNPVEHQLYLEYTVTGDDAAYMYATDQTSKTVLVPVSNTKYTIFIDSDGDLSILIKSDLTEDVAFDQDPVSVDYLTATHNPGFYLVVRKWSFN